MAFIHGTTKPVKKKNTITATSDGGQKIAENASKVANKTTVKTPSHTVVKPSASKKGTADGGGGQPRKTTAVINGRTQGYVSASTVMSAADDGKVDSLNKTVKANTPLGGKDSAAYNKEEKLNGERPVIAEVGGKLQGYQSADNTWLRDTNKDRASKKIAEIIAPSNTPLGGKSSADMLKDTSIGYVPTSANSVEPNKPITIDNSQLLNGQPYGDVKAAQDAQNAQDIAKVTDSPIANPTGGTGYTGGSASGGGGSSGTGTGGSGGTITTPEPTSGTSDNEYFDKLKTMNFEYDVSQDKQYLQAASMLENQVVQMMVGRGGLYSSVTQGALSSKLIELQVAYEKLAYQEFKEERSWNLQMASFIENKNATKFNQDMQIAQFKAQREDAAFSKTMQTKQYNLSAANASFARSQTKLAAQKETTSNQLALSMVDYDYAVTKKTELLKRWQQNGRSDPEINAFFGLKYNEPMGSTASTYAIYQKTQQLKTMLTGIQSTAREVGAVSAYQASLTGFTEQQIAPTTYSYSDIKKDITLGGTSSQLDNYRYEVSASTLGVNTKAEAQSAIAKALTSKQTLIAEMGTNYYNLMMDELYSLQSKYNYTTAGQTP